MPIAIGAGMAASGIITGMIGAAEAAKEREAAQAQLNRLYQDVSNIRIPTVEEQRIKLRDYVSSGLITPEQEEQILQDPSAMMQVTTDPRLKQAQISSLEKILQVSGEGITPVEQAAIKKLRSGVNQQDTARRQAVLQNMAQRGIGGSGIELAAQLQGAQAAAERESQGTLDIAAQAQQRALEAMSKGGTLASQIRGQEFGEEASRAQAADEIAKFNALQRSAVQQRNIQAQREAQYANLAQKQRIADLNTQLRQQEEMHNKALMQQHFQNQLAKEQAKSGIGIQQANVHLQGAKQKAQQWAQIGSGISSGLGAAGGYAGSGGSGGGGGATSGGAGTSSYNAPGLGSRANYALRNPELLEDDE